MNSKLLIKNISLYDNIESAKRFDILIESGKIAKVANSGDIKEKIPEISHDGLVAFPGLIDIHIHGAGGADSLDGKTESLEIISKTLASLGVTGFLSTMTVRPGKSNNHLQAAIEFKGRYLSGAGLLGIYIEGPFINNEKRGGIVPECITAPSPGVLDRILEQSGNFIKIMTVAPELPGIHKIIKTLINNNIVPAFGHSNADYEETKKGFDMGIKHVTHMFNTMKPLHHRDPGPVGAIYENPDISAELIADSHHIHPTLIGMTEKLIGSKKIICITDGISGMGLPDGKYTYNNKPYISERGLARYLDGTFIGSTMSLMNIVNNYILFTGCNLKDAIDTVTLNPARLLGIDAEKGSIETGKDADIVIADRSFNIRYTIVAGKIVYQSQNRSQNTNEFHLP